MTTRPRPLTDEELDRQVADLPGVHRDAGTKLAIAVRAPSFADAVRLVGLVARDADAMDHHPEIHLRLRTVTFVLSTNWERALTQLDVELAHQILESVRAVGAEVLPAPERVEIALDCVDADAVRPFWAAGLGYQEPTGAAGRRAAGPARAGPGAVVPADGPAAARPGRFHLDVHVPDDHAEARVQAVLAAGGHLVSDEHAPSWWVLADPEGNELCVCTRQPPAVRAPSS